MKGPKDSWLPAEHLWEGATCRQRRSQGWPTLTLIIFCSVYSVQWEYNYLWGSLQRAQLLVQFSVGPEDAWAVLTKEGHSKTANDLPITVWRLVTHRYQMYVQVNEAMVALNSSLVEHSGSLAHLAAIICNDKKKVGELFHKLQFCDVEIMNLLILSAWFKTLFLNSACRTRRVHTDCKGFTDHQFILRLSPTNYGHLQIT